MLYGFWISADGTFCCTVEKKWILLNFHTGPTKFAHISCMPSMRRYVYSSLIFHTCPAYLQLHIVFNSLSWYDSTMLWGSLWIYIRLFSLLMQAASNDSYCGRDERFLCRLEISAAFPSPHGSKLANNHV